jgi:ATP-dependent DNA ligase
MQKVLGAHAERNFVNEKHFTLARDWDFRDLTGWYWSEKFDGCRAYWDGAKLWTRGGNVIQCPRSFTRRLPAGVELDGELWAGHNTLTIAANAAIHGIWKPALRFMVFDVPDVAGNWLERMARATRFENDVVQCVGHGVVAHREHPSEIAAQIIGSGGEGAMFRNPEIRDYQRKRTVNLQRIKAANLYAPWHGLKPQKQSRNAGPVVGLDVSRFPFDPEIEWNIQQILDTDEDLRTLTRPI